MTKDDLATLYRAYIACLNRQDWSALGQFVAEDAIHNGQPLGLSGYRGMLQNDVSEIPDLYFDIQILTCDPPFIASRLAFNCSPKGRFFGLDINGRKVSFAENVIYDFDGGKIRQVWSVIDKTAIEAQL